MSQPGDIAIVLGAGWVLGGSFHAGVLLALRDACGIDASQSRTVIGTSAGAITAAFLGAGMSVDEIYSREIQRKTVRSVRSAHPTARGATRQEALAVNTKPSPRGMRRGADRVRNYFDDLYDGAQPAQPDMRFCAVDVLTGRRKAFGLDETCSTGTVVAAACAVPAMSRPVRIDGADFVDGAVHSATNADLARASHAGIVIVSAPMSISRRGTAVAALAPIRNHVRAELRREVQRLAPGTEVIIVEPTIEGALAMGVNLNKQSRRAQIAEDGYTRAVEVFERRTAGDRHVIEHRVLART